MTRTASDKFISIFDALKRTLISYDILQRRLWRNLRELESGIRKGDLLDVEGAEPLITAMAMVDTAHRYGQLVDALPFINKKSAETRALTQALQAVEGARHYFQHMRREINTEGPVDFPVLGGLSWANEHTNFMLSFAQKDPVGHTGLVWDTQERRFVNRLEYSVKKVQIDLERVGAAMHRAYEWIAVGAKFDPPEYAELTWGNTIALWTSFESTPEMQQAPDRAAQR